VSTKAVKKSEGGLKFDQGKPKLSLVTREMMLIIIRPHVSATFFNMIDQGMRAAHAPSADKLLARLELVVEIITQLYGVKETLRMTALAMEYGEKKYYRNNWKGGVEWSRLLDACLRHLVDAALGEEIDAESKNPHMSHALGSLLMLIGNITLSVGTDDLVFPPGALTT